MAYQTTSANVCIIVVIQPKLCVSIPTITSSDSKIFQPVCQQLLLQLPLP